MSTTLKGNEMNDFDLVATRLRECWAIRPRDALGTCGWINGEPWTVWYTKRKPAHIPEEK
jgi:hypothetical protein